MKGKNKFMALALSCLLLIGLIAPSVSKVHAAGETVTATVDGFGTVAVFTVGSDSWEGPNKTYNEDSPAWGGLGEVVMVDPGHALTQKDAPNYDSEFAEYSYAKADAGKTLNWYYKGTNNEFTWIETPVNSSIEVEGRWEDAVNHVVISYGDGKEKDFAIPYGKTFDEAGGVMPTDAEAKRAGYELIGWLTDGGEYFDASYRADEPITGPLSVEAEYQLVDTSKAELVDFAKKYPKTISGKCTVKETGTYKGHAKFAVHGLDGALAGKTATAYCMRPGAGTPFGNIPYTAERGDIKYNSDGSAQATYTIKIKKSPIAAAGSSYGYQLLQAKLTVRENTGGAIEIVKKSANPGITDENECYSLEGVKFGVYKTKISDTEVDKSTLVGTITIGANNKGSLSDLPQNTYYVQELAGFTGKHYAWNETVYTASVKAGTTVSKNISNIPQNDPVNILLGKVDAETNKNRPEGSASLKGARFVVEYYAKEGINADATYDSLAKTGVPLKADGTGDFTRYWVFETDENGFIYLADGAQKVDGNDLYYDAAGKFPVFPIGTYVIYEEKAPEGYLKNKNEFFLRNVTAPSTEKPTETINTYNAPDGDTAIKETVKRGDFEFTKVADTSLKRMANVPFKVTSKTTGEYHIIVTDDNGEFKSASSWSKHSNDTNANDKAYNKDTGEVDESKLDPEAGLWFGELSALDDNRGALLYDEYSLEELRSSANEGYALLDITFKVYRDQGDAPISVNLGTLTDDIINISTAAREKETGNQITYATKEITLVDTIEYVGFTKGETYTFVGKLMDKETGEPVLIDGKEVVSTVEKKLRASEGEVEVEFRFDASSLKGKDIVVFEKAYTAEGKVIASHEDINDEDQTITFVDPELGTTALDLKTNEHISFSNGKVTIIDTVDYSGLVPGEEVTVTGKMMDATSGEAMKDKSGKEITAETTFTPEEASGSVKVQFSFDASALAGKTGVVFEQLLFNKEIVASHEDIDDEDQTVYFPEIATYAFIGEEGQKTIKTSKATVTDKVTYKNVIPGKEYTLTAALVNKSTGKTVATGQTTFVAQTAEGFEYVKLDVNAEKYDGKNLVVYESLWLNNNKIASHDDITDKNQTVTVDVPGEPKTGDFFNLGALLVLLMASASGAASVLFRRRVEE